METNVLWAKSYLPPLPPCNVVRKERLADESSNIASGKGGASEYCSNSGNRHFVPHILARIVALRVRVILSSYLLCSSMLQVLEVSADVGSGLIELGCSSTQDMYTFIGVYAPNKPEVGPASNPLDSNSLRLLFFHLQIHDLPKCFSSISHRLIVVIYCHDCSC